MTQEEAARKIIEQGGHCRGIRCREDSCPLLTVDCSTEENRLTLAQSWLSSHAAPARFEVGKWYKWVGPDRQGLYGDMEKAFDGKPHRWEGPQNGCDGRFDVTSEDWSYAVEQFREVPAPTTEPQFKVGDRVRSCEPERECTGTIEQIGNPITGSNNLRIRPDSPKTWVNSDGCRWVSPKYVSPAEPQSMRHSIPNVHTSGASEYMVPVLGPDGAYHAVPQISYPPHLDTTLWPHFVASLVGTPDPTQSLRSRRLRARRAIHGPY